MYRWFDSGVMDVDVLPGIMHSSSESKYADSEIHMRSSCGVEVRAWIITTLSELLVTTSCEMPHAFVDELAQAISGAHPYVHTPVRRF